MCVYIYIYINNKKTKKKFKISKFPKKREKFSNEKSLWTRGIELPSDFLKKRPNFFLSFKIKKKKERSLLFKMVHEDPLDKTFSKS